MLGEVGVGPCAHLLRVSVVLVLGSGLGLGLGSVGVGPCAHVGREEVVQLRGELARGGAATWLGLGLGLG